MSGRATFTGTTFQSEVSACVAGLLLTERHLLQLGDGLPGTPQKIQFETLTGVDDLLITTDKGEVYVQAKRTLPLSPKTDGILAAVAEQFVQQFRVGTLENGVRRDLVPDRDRLVLAVSTEAADTVGINLRQALDRQRTRVATAMPQKLQEALTVFTQLVAAAWLTTAGTPITVAEQQALLELCSVTVIGSSERRLVEEALRELVEPGAETALVDLLVTWAGRAAGEGTGGDAAAIRLALLGKCQLKAPPSFQADLARLRAYSAATLNRLAYSTTIDGPEGPVGLTRPVAGQVAAAARQGTLALTGEPGAGKSAILHAVAGELGQQHPVFCLPVESGAGTLAALQQEIGLAHPVGEVLRQVPGVRPAYLLLDALDASRGGPAETTYKKLLEEVAALPDWRVVAAVRSFDLRLGQDWQRLFKGTPPYPEYADPRLPVVRHLHLGLLDDAECADLARQSPALDAALAAAGPRLQALARNPFNLALLAELLAEGTPAAALAAVATRGQLLHRYWQARIDGLGTPAIVSLARLVEQLLQAKATTLPQTRLETATAATIDALERAGILVQETGRRAVGFRHLILFDYAVAQLALLPGLAEATAQLRQERAAGLLLAPALAYWVEELKSTAPREFWPFVAALVADAAIDPLVRVEVARLVVEGVQPADDLTELARFFASNEAAATRSLRQFSGALLTRAEAGQSVAAGPWAELLTQLSSPTPDQLGSVQTLLGVLLGSCPSATALAHLGEAARRLYAQVAANEHLTTWLARAVIPYLVQTYGTDPAASRYQLTRPFEPVRFARFGYLELPALARHGLALAAHDPDLLVRLYYQAFQAHPFRRDQSTTMLRSAIMPLHSNAAQDFEQTGHQLAQQFPALLAADPATGLRALAATLRGAQGKLLGLPPGPPVRLPVGGQLYPFEEDSSWLALNQARNRASSVARIYQAFQAWLLAAPAPALLALPALLLAETGTALVWRVLFEAGAAHPAVLGPLLEPAAAGIPALQSPSTRPSVVELLALLYPQWPAADRQAAEQQWLAADFSHFPNPAVARTLALGKLLNTLGESQLVTQEARDFLQVARQSGFSLVNDKPAIVPPVEFSRWSEDDEEPALEELDLIAGAASPAAQLPTDGAGPVLTPLQAVRAAQADLPIPATEAAATRLREALFTLGATGDPTATHPDDDIAAALAEGWSALLAYWPATAAAFPAAVTALLALTHHPSPATTPATESEFARTQVRGYPLARAEAAQAVAALVTVPGLWPLIAARVEALLLHDPHPAVRLQLLPALQNIYRVDEEAAWQLATKFASTETNPALVRLGALCLHPLAYHDAARLEPLVLQLVPKAAPPSGGPDALVHLLVFLAFPKGLTASQTQLQDWLTDYTSAESYLHALLAELQNYFALGYGPASATPLTLAHQARALVLALVAAVRPAAAGWPTDSREPTAMENAALRLLDEAARQLFYAVDDQSQPAVLETAEAQRQWLADYSSLIAQLTALGSPGTVHQVLELLRQFLAADPASCFDLVSQAILRATGIAGFEHEAIAVTQVVELVSRYLADYRPVFTDETRRNQLIACLAVFVEAGWPEARNLFYQLPDLL